MALDRFFFYLIENNQKKKKVLISSTESVLVANIPWADTILLRRETKSFNITTC